MKQKVLKNVWLRTAMIVAVVTTAFAGTAWAEIHPITVELEGFTATSGQIDGNISYSTSSDGSYSAEGVLTATTFILTAANNAKINSVTFHWTVGWSDITCVPNIGDPKYFVANINEQDKQYPTVSGFNCDEISFSHTNSNGLNPTFDYISVTYTPGTPDYTITAQSSDTNKGTVELDGNVIIAKPNHGYGVDETNPFTITAGEATVTPYNNNYFAVDPSTACTVTINFVAHEAESKIDFEHDLDSYTDWEHGGTIVRSQRYQGENAHGGKGFFGITNANTAWMKTVNKIGYPGTFTCYVRRTQYQESLTWKIQVCPAEADTEIENNWETVKSYTPSGTTATSWEEFSADLSLHTDVYVRLYYTGSSIHGAIDDIDLTETTATVKVSVSGYNYSTFCSHRALDFTESDIKVYYITATGSKLTFTQITKLPADTGVLLYKAGGVTDEEVPALIGTADVVPSTNVLVPGTDAAVTWTENDRNYILYHGEFYKANASPVAVGRAYIHLPADSQVKSLRIDLEDNATSIGEELRAKSEESDGAIYNVAGQRLQKMQKGVNIVNGKKILK